MRKTYQDRKIETEIMVDDLDQALYSLGTAQATAYLNTLSYLKYRPTGMSKPDWAKAKGDVRRLARKYLNDWQANNA